MFYGSRGGYMSPNDVAKEQQKNSVCGIMLSSEGHAMGGHRRNYKFCESCRTLKPHAGISKKGWRCSGCKNKSAQQLERLRKAEFKAGA